MKLAAALLCLIPALACAQSAPTLVDRPGSTPSRSLTAADLVSYLAAKRDLSAALAFEGATNAALATLASGVAAKLTAPASPFTVFVGSAGPDFANLANPVAAGSLLALGNVGLYQHANGNSAVGASTMASMRTVWGLAGNSSDQTVGEVGGGAPFVPVPAGYKAFFGTGYPPMVVMNYGGANAGGTGTYTAGAGDAKPGTAYPYYVTAADLASQKQSIDAAVAAGARSVAIVVSPNLGVEDTDDPVATSAYWANVRAEAMYGGGIALDVPPSFWAARPAAYASTIRQWSALGRSLGVPVYVIVSPFATTADASGNSGGCGFDPNFLANTQLLVADLAAAPPTQWGVESYCGSAGSANTTNQITAAGGPGTINEVALFLARSAPTSAPGTAVSAASGVAQASFLANRPRAVMFARDLPGLRGLAFQDPSNAALGGTSTFDGVSIGSKVRPGASVAFLDSTGPIIGRYQIIGTNAAGTTTVLIDPNAAGGYVKTNNGEFQGTLKGPIFTPSSTSPCVAGSIFTDASYLYVCTATNIFKRAPLTAF